MLTLVINGDMTLHDHGIWVIDAELETPEDSSDDNPLDFVIV